MAITDTFSADVLALTETLRAAINDPADQIRLLVQLTQFSGLETFDSSLYCVALQATASLCRRAALVSLANATADYSPTSSNEALDILAVILPLYDAEILNSADVGDIETYQTMRDLRGSITADLQRRAISLASLITIQRQASLPSLVNAWSLYADAAREGELVSRNNGIVIHPCFFPLSYEALSQ